MSITRPLRPIRIVHVVLCALLLLSAHPRRVAALADTSVLWSQKTSESLVVLQMVSGHIDIKKFNVENRAAFDTTLRMISHLDGVLGIEWDVSVATTGDMYDALLWNLDKVAARDVWPLLESTTSPVVAVIDTGVTLHADLADKVLIGRNTITDTQDTADGNGHGTHVAGIIAATSNNDIGIAGIAPTARILPLKALNDDGTGAASDVAEAIIWAVDQRVDVINLSLGSADTSLSLKAAIDYAAQNDVPVIAAAGNDGSTDVRYYPAAYDSVIAVAATAKDDTTPSWSNRASWVDIAAPGVAIPSTTGTDSYALMSGTSVAAPHVAAQFAILSALHPEASVDTLRTWVESSATDIDIPGIDARTGAGRINIAASVQYATGPAVDPPTPTIPDPPAIDPPTLTIPDPPAIDPPVAEPSIPLPIQAPRSVSDMNVAVQGVDLVVSASYLADEALSGFNVFRNGKLIAITTLPHFVDLNAATRRQKITYALQAFNDAGTSEVVSRSIRLRPPQKPTVSPAKIRRQSARFNVTTTTKNAQILCYADGTLTTAHPSGRNRAVCSFTLARGVHRIEVRISSRYGTSAATTRTVKIR